MSITVYDDKGLGAEIGKPYEFSNNGEIWYIHRLQSIERNGGRPYKAGWGYWKKIRKIESVGDLYRKLVELVEGECYEFTDPNSARKKGVCIAGGAKGPILYARYGAWEVDECTDIKLLVLKGDSNE